MKRSLSLILAVLMLAAAFVSAIPASASAFDDVAETRWSAASIKYAVDMGYMKGVGERIFSPAGTLTRAMVATVLWRRQGEPAPTAPSGFDDVPAGKWYSDAVAWAKETGVVRGVSDTKFKPDDNVTREQLATMLFRYSAVCPVSVPERADLAVFPDGAKVAEWAREAMGWAVEAALVKGKDNGSLDPSGFATREQFAAIIERFDNTFRLEYNQPVLRSHYIEKPYPLVTDADYYVATDGDDSANGSFDHPFRTWERARDAVRTLDRTGKTGITVAFFAGNYGPLSVCLTEEDSGSPDCPVTYCTYGDGDVVFENGVTLRAEDFSEIDEDERALFGEKNAKSVRKVDLTDYFDEIPAFPDFVLFGGDKIMTAARFPNRYSDGGDHLIPSGETFDNDSLLLTMPLLYRRIASYTDGMIREMRIYGYITAGYRKDSFRTTGYDRENRLLDVAGRGDPEGDGMRDGWHGAEGDGIMMCVTNVPLELDSADEYYVDRSTGTLYVFDPHGEYRMPMGCGEKKIRGGDFDPGTGSAATADYVMVDIENAGYITLRGLSFTNTLDGIVLGYKTSGIRIDRCSFSYSTGKNQTLFEYSLDGAPLALSVTDSEFDFSVGSSVFVLDEADGPDRYTNRSDVIIDNCLFSRANLAYDVEGSVNLYKCSGGTVTHNRFENCSRCGVMYQSSFDILIEYNDFDSVMTNSEDGGVTRTWGNMDGNCVIRYNFYNKISSSQGVGRLAHYSDDGDCGTEMYSNLFYYSGDVVFAGAGRDNAFRSNAVVGSSRVIVQSMTSGIREAGDAARGSWPIYIHLARWADILEYIATVEGYADELEARRPGATSFSFDFNGPLDKNFVFAPVTDITDNAYFDLEAWMADRYTLVGDAADYCTVGGNAAYGPDENPIFVNPTLGDYRIREGADFPDYHFEEMGRY